MRLSTEGRHCLSSVFPANCRDFVTRVLPVLLIAVLLTVPAAADEPRFFIERIRVDGIRWSSENVLLAESRLDPGRTYTEGELRDAMARIRRLPFVLHTDFRLEKGTLREQYVLVIDVDETSPLFGSVTIGRVVIEPARRRLPPGLPGAQPRRMTIPRNRATFGGRIFAGANGVFHAGLEKGGDLLEGKPRETAGYTHYDVFGSGASLALLVTHDDRDYMPGTPEHALMRTRDEFSYAAVAAVPLFANQSLRASWDRSTFPTARVSSAPGGFEVFRFHRDTMKLAWIHDTTDDPLLPSRGTFLTAGVQLSEEPRFLTGAVQTRDVTAAAVRYWDVTPRQSLLTGGEFETFGGWRQNERRARIGYSGKLLDRDQSLRWGDLRFDAAVERIYYATRGEALESRTILSGGISYRNRWGIARFEVEYLGWRDLRR